MVSIKSLAISMLFAQCEASLRPSTSERHLSNGKLATYESRLKFSDHAAIDLDQAEMENQLAGGTESSYVVAKGIYENGGSSKSFAEVTIEGGTPGEILKGTEIIGQTQNGDDVRGVAYAKFDEGSAVIQVQYATSDDLTAHVNCKAGGLVAAQAAVLDGCFNNTGTMEVTGVGSVTYSYNKRQDNKNGRTLQGFSTQARAKMRACTDCSPYSDYEKFYNYYGHFDYGDKWVQAAFAGTQTSFTKGNANFGLYSFRGKTEVIQKGTVYLNVLMYVIYEMEDALDDCQVGCLDCNDDPVHAWDEAVAFYTGSLEGESGFGAGKLLFALADKRCANFKTCGTNGDGIEGISKLNHEIISEFKKGQRDLLSGKCSDARKKKERIAQLMFVPLIQGTLRYAHITAKDPTAGEKAEAEGAVFAAAVLPVVHACNEGDATTIYDNMKVGSDTADYKAVKSAFENNYGCMKISCKDVGGLYDDGYLEYYEGMEPCTDGSDKNTVGIAIGATVGALVVIVAGFFLYRRRRASGVEDKFSGSTAGTEVA